MGINVCSYWILNGGYLRPADRKTVERGIKNWINIRAFVFRRLKDVLTTEVKRQVHKGILHRPNILVDDTASSEVCVVEVRHNHEFAGEEKSSQSGLER